MARIPFTLDRKSSQTQQMVDGVMSAIAARHWKPGDTLPTAAEFGKALGTGGYVPRTALRQLADEGVVILKKHVGAVVARQKPTVKCRDALPSSHADAASPITRTSMPSPCRTSLNRPGGILYTL